MVVLVFSKKTSNFPIFEVYIVKSSHKVDKTMTTVKIRRKGLLDILLLLLQVYLY